MTPEVAPLAEDELEPAAALLARAFGDNPLNRAVMPGLSRRARVRRNRWGMRATLPTARHHGWVRAVREDGATAGVLVATGPRAWPLPPAAFRRRLRSWWGQGPAVARRWDEVFARLAESHPVVEHWYLATLGVDPERQHRGLGRRLLASWLEQVDRDALPAWLETDRPENLGFYQAAGFALAGELRVLETDVWLMERPPQGGS